jgi:hypothetical protein
MTLSVVFRSSNAYSKPFQSEQHINANTIKTEGPTEISEAINKKKYNPFSCGCIRRRGTFDVRRDEL